MVEPPYPREEGTAVLPSLVELTTVLKGLLLGVWSPLCIPGSGFLKGERL